VPISACGGRLRVIACIEESRLIQKILGHVQRRENLTGITARGPPTSQHALDLGCLTAPCLAWHSQQYVLESGNM
jgi:hypothetical protein